MTVTVVRSNTRPALRQRQGTILDIATVIDTNEGLWPTTGDPLGTADYQSFACGGTPYYLTGASFCTPTANKTFASAGWSYAKPFSVYRGVSCKSVGFDWDQVENDIEVAFAAIEASAVESAVGDIFGNDGDTVDGTAVDLPIALGNLEQHAANFYGFEPILFMSRRMAATMCGRGLVVGTDGALHTCLGTRVVGAGGYDGTVGPAATSPGQEWIHAFGEITLRRSAVETFKTLDQTTNDIHVLAERAYAATVDCGYVASSLATVQGCC
jgi:hypothetical protein